MNVRTGTRKRQQEILFRIAEGDMMMMNYWWETWGYLSGRDRQKMCYAQIEQEGLRLREVSWKFASQ